MATPLQTLFGDWPEESLQLKKQKKSEERKRRRIIGLGDVYDGFDEISYDSPDFFERDEEESMMFNQKVLGTEKRSDETDEEFKKRVAKLLSAVMKREGLSDEKGEKETEEEFNQRIENEKKEAESMVGPKLQGESDDSYQLRIKEAINEIRKKEHENKNPQLKKDGESTIEYGNRREKEKKQIMNRNGLGDFKGDLESELIQPQINMKVVMRIWRNYFSLTSNGFNYSAIVQGTPSLNA
ncbi:MAG: hypothetical protein EZS28_030186 [Streblomastix strix]|uniref:Uncharacterized protein n=1 Tax=Streblomastix strix TaxID=222440 RepID=A0A5J4UVE6_9EUKA|nr:MAG: hypothetical protein EZS28_030186 [Streblomastix strix]